MKKLRPMVTRYLSLVILVMMIVILISMSVLEILSIQDRTRASANMIFGQIRQILEENREELKEVQQQYADLCLANLRTVSYILESRPEITENLDVAELIRIADFVQVDEIHIFDAAGTIVFGTQPQYFGFTFDSGEQIGFFKPLLTDHSLTMIQDITPNTAEGKPVQYSARWSDGDHFIVEIGMYPEAVLQAREKNEISYIFSLLKANAGIELFATDIRSSTILGCTNSQYTGKTHAEIGLPTPDQIQSDSSFTAEISGIQSYAIFTREDDMLLGYVTPLRAMYGSTVRSVLFFAAGLMLIALIVIMMMGRFLRSYVINDIEQVNANLRQIREGDLSVSVDARNSQEFSELSRHINDMVSSLVESRKQIEKDRDMDLLTEMYNRRGLDNKMLKLQQSGEDLGCCAMIMVDADRLKEINDRYGHESGDLYLCRVGEALRQAGVRKSVYARQGGDEFVLFLYGYESDELLNGAIDNLRSMQDGQMVELRDGVMVEMQFSIGCSRGRGQMDFQAMLKEADAAMYENKRKRHCRI